MTYMRFLLGLWFILGIGYATTTMAAELFWKQAYDLVGAASKIATKDNPDATVTMITALAQGTEKAEIAARLAPEIHWLRSTPAQIATENPMLDDAKAIELLRAELVYDPYNPKWLGFLALRLKHSARMAEAADVYRRIKEIWPGSPMERVMREMIGPFGQ